MAISVVMPALELAQETGKVLVWIKKEGDKVVKGEPLLEIETDKVSFELEAQADGILAGVRSREGDVVPVGQIIAWLVAPGEQPPAESDTASRAMAEQARPMTAASAPRSAAAAPAAEKPAEGGPRISPKARRMAQELGVDISRIVGTGPGGTISGEDVQAAAAKPTLAAPPSETLSTIARLMAERTTQSWTTVPHFFLTRDVDASALQAAREQLGRDKFTHTDLLIALVARTLLQHPKIADGERSAGDIGGPQTPGFGSLREVFALRGDFCDRHRRRVGDHRTDHTLGNGDRQRDVDRRVEANRAACPARVHLRMSK